MSVHREGQGLRFRESQERWARWIEVQRTPSEAKEGTQKLVQLPDQKSIEVKIPPATSVDRQVAALLELAEFGDAGPVESSSYHPMSMMAARGLR